MRILIATDAWHPQVNGVVRTLTSLAHNLATLGVAVEFVSPEGFLTVPMPTYPSLRLAVPSRSEIARRIEQISPDAIHIATEGPIGFMVRAYCLKHGIRFTTCYATRFPEYVAARVPIPEGWVYEALRRFHAPATVTMVSTASLKLELSRWGFKNLGLFSRGVDTEMFRPNPLADLDLPRPVFLSAGRIAIEKNLDAFLSLKLPGSKVVIGEGPQEAELRQRYPDAIFLGLREGRDLAAHIAAADVFVFPSKTDTFGVVQLEALACGVPVAAFPVAGPRDVIGRNPVGVLDHDLQEACIKALQVSRQACREFALTHSWATSARQFLGHVSLVAGGGSRVAPTSNSVSATASR